MRPQVDGKLGRDKARRQEVGELDVRAEALAPARPRVEGAHAVHEQAHVAAAFGRGAQGGGEALAHFVVTENEARQEDPFPGLADGLEHDRIGGLAVVQHGEAVAFDHAAPGDAGTRIDEVVPCRGDFVLVDEAFRFFRQRFAVQIHKAAYDLPGGFFHKPDGLAVDPGDPEQPVQRQPDRGHKEDDGDPAEGRPGITLVQQGMAGAVDGEPVHDGHEYQQDHRIRDEDQARHGQQCEQEGDVEHRWTWRRASLGISGPGPAPNLLGARRCGRPSCPVWDAGGCSR